MSQHTASSSLADAPSSVIPADYLDLLDAPAFAHIATIGPTGAPQVSPVWFHWDGTHLRFSQLPNAQKLKNLRRDDRISMSIIDPANDYRYLEVRGRVTAIDDDPGYTFLSAMAGKYWGLDTYPYIKEGAVPVILTVEPLATSQMDLTPPVTR